MKRIVLAAFVIAACAVVPGCVLHTHGQPHGYHHADVAVTIPIVHVHDEGCGHYYRGGVWYYRTGHRHGQGCGHVFLGGRWCHP